MAKNTEWQYKAAKAFGLALIGFLWFIALKQIDMDYGGEFYLHMHDGKSDIWNFTGLVLISLLALSLTGWYDLDKNLNDWRADNTRDFATKRDIPTMLIRGGQIVIGIAAFIMLAAG